jgi:ABC-type cobalamin transport system permease subunit
MIWKAVNMERCALSLILKMKSQLICFTKLNQRTPTSIYSTSRLHGAPGAMTTTKKAVCMLITGRISEESPTFTITIETCALIGILTILLGLISMDVKRTIAANIVMAGRNNSIIPEILKSIRANSSIDAKRFIVHIITMMMTNELI